MFEQILAQEGLKNPILQGSLGKGSEATGLTNAGNLISAIISLFLLVSLIASLIYFIIGGLSWILSDGDKGKLEQARNRITQAIIGLIIVASSWAIWTLVGNFIGLDVNNLPFPTLGQ